MDEAKQLVHMAISAMFAAAILGAAVALITVGWKMWGAFSRQETANAQMKDYVNYAAYNNTTVRGQEVISLLNYANLNGYFVLLVPANSTSTPVHGSAPDLYTIGSELHTGGPVHLYVPNSCGYAYVKKSLDGMALPADPVMNSVYTAAKTSMAGYLPTNPTSYCASLTDAANSQNVGDLTSFFTDNTGVVGGCSSNLSKGNDFASFQSHVIYGSSTDTEVLGFVLIKYMDNTRVR